MDDAPPLGDRPDVVLLFYLLVFLPWSALQALDFIGPAWKTVDDTRRDGFLHFLITLVPLFAIVFYLYLQHRARDYKEFSAALVALCFAATHLASTWWGLTQLHHFRSWAIHAIRVLESQGTPYILADDHHDHHADPHHQHQHRHHATAAAAAAATARSKAGRIKVNESIVDNSIFVGQARCYALRRGAPGRAPRAWMQLVDRRHRRWYSRLVIVLQAGVVVVASWLCNLLHLALRAARLRRRRDPGSPWTLRPYEPVDLWINWAVAFAAQGLHPWIAAFDAPPVPPPPNGRDAAGYARRQAYFAKEVLAAAVLLAPDRHFLHAKRGVAFGDGHPLRWGLRDEPTPHSAFASTARIDKMDMLRSVMLSGRNLPFDAPQLCQWDAAGARLDAVSANLRGEGYRSYEYDLKEAVGNMPSKFGNAIDMFTIDMLEWLTIMLGLGLWEHRPKKKKKKEEEEGRRIRVSPLRAVDACWAWMGRVGRRPRTVPFASEDLPDESSELIEVESLSESDDDDNGGDEDSSWSDSESSASEGEGPLISTMKNKGEKGLGEESTAVAVLRMQLGIAEGDSTPLVYENGKGFAALPVPIKQVGVGGVLWKNRAVLKISALIDNWVALNSGDAISQVIKQDPEWQEACLTLPNSRSDSGDEGGTALAQRRREIEAQLKGESYLVYANDILERLSVNAQLSTRPPSNLNLDHTISFVGVVMESVRSSLAAHLPKRGGRFHEPPGQWKQSIQFLDSDYLLTDAYESVLSESLTCALRSFEKKTEQAVGDTHKSVLSRPIQLRLLWELQTEFQRLANDVRKPQQISSMIACILAFPSLTFTSKLLKRISTRTSRLHRSATNVEFHSTREVFIRPVCAPQNFYLVVSVICGRNTPASVSVQLAREDCTSDNYFDWEAWRDAFNGRLRGLKGWQKAQGMSVFEECTTYASIRRSIERWKLPDPRTGSQLRIWAGWLPHRPVIAKYELGTEGLIRQYAISGNGAEEGKPIDYAIASREDLRYSLGAVEERIFQVQRIERESKGEDKPHPRHTSVVAKPADQFLEQGKKLLDGKKGNIPLALQYFELAARNGNVDGLRYAVDLLMDKTSGHVNLNKALFLTKRFDWMLGTRDSTVQERAQAIEEIYQKLLTRTRNACSVVLGFAAFELQRIERMEFNGAMSTGDVMNILAQSFRQSGHIETLRYIVILSVHSAWLRANINPLGTTELLPVTSWGSWLISSSSQRAMLGNRHFRRARGGRSLLEIFFYTAGKSTRDWEWLDAVIQRDDIMRYIREDALEEIIQKKDKGAPERNKSILRLLRRALKDYRSSAKASILLGEIYENGVVGIDPSLQSAIEVYGEGARQANLEATERLGAILKRLPQENQSCRFKILEALRESESPKNARASFVLGDWYEHGLGGVQTDLHQAIQLYGKAAKLHDKLAAERLGDIVRQDWTETDGAHQSALKLLQEAARDRDENSALILGGIYEAGLKGLVRDCGRAVELYHIGLDQGNYESSERLRIMAQSEAVECMVLRHQIIERLYDSVLEGNAQAARVLGNLCENGLDIVASNETALSQLCAMKFYDSYVIRLLGSVAMRKESKALPIMQEILQALFGAAELGISDAAVALANIKEEEKNIADAVEVLGIAAVSEGDVTSISRLGKMALEHNGSVKARVMQILHEASDLDHIHAITVQALVLQKSAKGDVKTRYMSKAVEFFAKAAHTGHDGAVVLLRNIAFSHCGDEHGRIALENLIDVAWREGCSETCATQALDAVGYVLDTSQCSNSENAAASLDLFQEVSRRVYSHQYSSFHQLEVAFSAARGLKALTTSGRSTKDIKEQARLRLQEYAEDGREGPMEFFAGCLLNEVPMDEENMPEVVSHSSETRNVEARNVGKRNVKAQKALQLYADLIKMERAKTSRRGLGHDEKATRIGEAEIKGMRRGVALLESPGLTSEQDAGLRDQLLKRCNILETKVKGHRAHLRNLANILEWH